MLGSPWGLLGGAARSLRLPLARRPDPYGAARGAHAPVGQRRPAGGAAVRAAGPAAAEGVAGAARPPAATAAGQRLGAAVVLSLRGSRLGLGRGEEWRTASERKGSHSMSAAIGNLINPSPRMSSHIHVCTPSMLPRGDAARSKPGALTRGTDASRV